MNWFRRGPSPEAVAVEAVEEKLQKVRAVRKSTLQDVMNKINQISVDEGIRHVGQAFGGKYND